MYFNDAVLYVNPYMVVTPRGYTKHYYNGNQRVAAYIGDITDLPNDIIDISDQALERISNAREYMYSLLNANEVQYMEVLDSYVDIDGNPLAELQWSCYDGDWILNTNVSHRTNFLYPILAKSANLSQRDVPSLYYYHPDHLGSTTWVTDESGEPVEYIHYMPYGELWVDQQATGYSERFKFTGKERDSESGYDYFGARYYSSTFPMWLSVDPLSNKYPHISPYAYCGNNPIKFVDPDGRFPLISPLIGYLALARTMESTQRNHEVKTVRYSMLHPINALKIGNAEFPPNSISNIVCRFQVNLENEAGFSKGIGGQSNAYRHTLWQAILANTFGTEHAIRIGNVHEDILPIDMSVRLFRVKNDADTMADLLNNIIGREISADNKGLRNKQYAELVLKEYKNNGLWVVTGNEKDGYFVRKSKLTQEQYDRALQVVKTRGNNGLLE